MAPRVLRPQRASALPHRPSIMVYGSAGAGKTRLHLEIAKLTGARALVIDTEHGTDPYRKHYDFDVIHTDSPPEIEAQVDYYLERPEGYTMLVVDPISCVHAALENMADDELRPKRKADEVGRFGSVIDPAAKNILKRIARILPAKLHKLDMAKIVTARAKPVWQDWKRVGETWEGDNSLEYEFDLVLELKVVGVNRIATVKKARGLQMPRTIDDFTAAKLLEFLPAEGFSGESTPNPLVTDEQAEEIRRLLPLANLDPAVWSQALTQYGATCIEDMPRAAAGPVIARLRAKVEHAKVEQQGARADGAPLPPTAESSTSTTTPTQPEAQPAQQ